MMDHWSGVDAGRVRSDWLRSRPRFRPLAIATALVLGVATYAQQSVPPPAEPVCEIDGVERIVAIGDVHGAFDRFVAILRTTGLIDERLRWTGGKTHLVQVGDVVDRGADSRKALDLLERLQKDALRAGGAVHPLLGNHEVMRMLGDLRYVVPGEYEAFVTATSEQVREQVANSQPAIRDQLIKDTPLGSIEMRVAFGQKGHYGEWLRKLNVVMRINGVLFLHGGISPRIAGMSCETINITVRRELTADLKQTRNDPLAGLGSAEDGPLWYRGLAQEPDEFAAQVDDILAKQHARALVIGHTVTPNSRIRARFGGKVFQIDTGMQPAYVPAGRASALEIQRGELTAIYQDGREMLGSLPAPSPAAVPTLR